MKYVQKIIEVIDNIHTQLQVKFIFESTLKTPP